MKRLLQFLEIEPGELTLESFKREVDWTWLLLIAGVVLFLAVLRMPV